jgi:hypothetical protein
MNPHLTLPSPLPSDGSGEGTADGPELFHRGLSSSGRFMVPMRAKILAWRLPMNPYLTLPSPLPSGGSGEGTADGPELFHGGLSSSGRFMVPMRARILARRLPMNPYLTLPSPLPSDGSGEGTADGPELFHGGLSSSGRFMVPMRARILAWRLPMNPYLTLPSPLPSDGSGERTADGHELFHRGLSSSGRFMVPMRAKILAWGLPMNPHLTLTLSPPIGWERRGNSRGTRIVPPMSDA